VALILLFPFIFRSNLCFFISSAMLTFRICHNFLILISHVLLIRFLRFICLNCDSECHLSYCFGFVAIGALWVQIRKNRKSTFLSIKKIPGLHHLVIRARLVITRLSISSVSFLFFVQSWFYTASVLSVHHMFFIVQSYQSF